MPTFSDLEFSDEDLGRIGAATAADGLIDWEHVELSPLKQRIKDLHRQIQLNSCCYCRKSFDGEFQMVIDIEHILPKQKFVALTFSAVNLSVACKRCNMNVKGVRWGFVRGLSVDEMGAMFAESEAYEIIHPNLDIYAQNLPYLAVDCDGVRFKKFQKHRATEKGVFTYDFFRLSEVEVGDLDALQGLNPSDDSVGAKIVRAVEQLVGEGH